ncbi:MAG: hypothetical protein RL556_43 [Actinomycetota bacterium]
MTPEPRMTRSEQRDAARAKAQQLREQNKRKETTKRVALRVSLVVGVAAVITAVVAVIITGANTQAPNGGVPANLTFNSGIKIGTGLQAYTDKVTPTPVPNPTATAAAVPNIVMYIDYQCPVCEAFETANQAQVRSWVESGAATVEIHPISFLDGSSANNYSSRAANAALCVANYAPNSFFDYNAYLFAHQPAEQTAGPENKALVAGTKLVSVTNATKIENCINNKMFAGWLKTSTSDSMTNNVEGTSAPVKGTPTVVVNGNLYGWSTGEELTSAARFAQFVQQAVGN